MTRAMPLSRYSEMLSELEREHRRRQLIPRLGLDFASNDYLGLATSARMANAVAAALANGTPIGATGSRLLRGNAPEHEELEMVAAKFFGAERSLFFGGGYLANVAVLTTLPQKEDLVILDQLVHASTREGSRGGRAQVVEVPHNDIDAVEDAILKWKRTAKAGRIWIAVESLYSMDGDRAPLAELARLADTHNAFLLIDEAHATGIYGPDGRGLAHDLEGRDNVVVLHTCGKALGCSGALVLGSAVLCDFLVNRCKPFIYATAPSPLMAVAATEAIAILQTEPERRQQLFRLIDIACRELRDRCGIEASGSQIVPILIGNDQRAMALASALQKVGFDIRGIRPPTVPAGTARLRLSLTLNVSDADVSHLVECLADELRKVSA
jgi:8-amino-7-oxononanoate synthase